MIGSVKNLHIVGDLALRSNAQGRIEVVGMRKLTILVGPGLGAFPVTIMGVRRRGSAPQPRLGGRVSFLWTLEGLLSSILVRPNRLPHQPGTISRGSLGCLDRLPAERGPGTG